MKVLVVDPGADWSTADVHAGLVAGLRACGQEVVEFRYGRKMAVIDRAYHGLWLADGKKKKHPTTADAAYTTSELVVTWALRLQPDWVLVVSGMFFHPDALVLARRAGLRTAVLLTESPYDTLKEIRVAGLADMVWTNERTAVPVLQEVNPHARYLAHAWAPERHGNAQAFAPFDEVAPAHDVVFVGTGFAERVELLQGVDWTGVDLGLYGSWSLVPSRSRLRRCLRGGIVENVATASLYRKAKIGLNLFRTSMGFGRKAPRLTGAESLGPRAYELAACGSFFMSERRPEVEEIFGDAVPTFDGPKELQALLARWLPDDLGRRRMAARLPAMVRGHSWHDRAGQIVADLAALSAGSGLRAPVTTAVPSSVAAVGPSGMGAPAVV